MYLGDDWASREDILAFLIFDNHKGPERTIKMVGRSYFSNP